MMMTKKTLFIAVLACTAMLSGCSDDKVKPTGLACLGEDGDTLVENMIDVCKAGDAIATKHPAYFCDFNYAVSYNKYNSAFCVYVGKVRTERAFQDKK